MEACVAGEEDGMLVLVTGKGEIPDLAEHDLRDIEFVLAQRRAMSRRCEETDGEHTCAVFPGHPVSERYSVGHQCRACTYRWFHSGRPEDQAAHPA